MNLQTREILRLFVEKADELEKWKFIGLLRRQGGPFKLFTHHNNDGSIEIENVGPDDDSTRAFLPTFRLFIMQNELISLHRLDKLCDDPGLSDKWKREILACRKSYFKFIKEPVRLLSPADFATREEIVKTIIDGGIFHLKEREERQRYGKWKQQDEKFAHIVIVFNSTLYTVYHIIIRISKITKEELNRPNCQ